MCGGGTNRGGPPRRPISFNALLVLYALTSKKSFCRQCLVVATIYCYSPKAQVFALSIQECGSPPNR
jgi:hypothetical protein